MSHDSHPEPTNHWKVVGNHNAATTWVVSVVPSCFDMLGRGDTMALHQRSQVMPKFKGNLWNMSPGHSELLPSAVVILSI